MTDSTDNYVSHAETYQYIKLLQQELEDIEKTSNNTHIKFSIIKLKSLLQLIDHQKKMLSNMIIQTGETE